MEYKIWMVKGESGGPPSKVHKTEASATVEAKRLARLHPGTKFYVLEAMTVWMTAQPEAHGMECQHAPA